MSRKFACGLILLACTADPPIAERKPEAPVEMTIEAKSTGLRTYDVVLVAKSTEGMPLHLRFVVPSGVTVLSQESAAGMVRMRARLDIRSADIAGVARVELAPGKVRTKAQHVTIGEPARERARAFEVILPSGEHVAEVRE